MTRTGDDDLNLRLVRYFVAVAETLHFSRAASLLYIAQPSLSAQIRVLESQLGTPLFTRTSRRVELTPAGRRFYDAAVPLLAAARSARLAVAGAHELRLATILDGLDTVPAIVDELWSSDPALRVSIGMAGMPAQLAAVLDGRLDAAVGMSGELPPELEGMHIRNDLVRVVIRADHPAAATGHVLDLERLHGAGWVLGSVEHTPDWVEFVRHHLTIAGADLSAARTALVPLSAMLDEVMHRGAVAPWPESCPQPPAGLVLCELPHTPVFKWQLVWPRGRRNEPAIRALRAAARRTAERCAWLDGSSAEKSLPQFTREAERGAVG